MIRYYATEACLISGELVVPESHEPIFVARLRAAADRLRTVLLETPFPPLEPPPTTNEELARVHSSVREWARVIFDAHEGRPSRVDEAGLAALLTRRGAGNVVVETPPIRYGEIEREIRAASRGWMLTNQPRTTASKLIAKPVRTFRYATSPLDFIGEAPSNLQFSGAGHLCDAKVPNFVSQSPPYIALKLDNWHEIVESLETARQYIMYKGFRLIAWVHTEIKHFEEAAYPRISLTVGSGKKYLLRVEHCGVNDDRSIPHSEALLLRNLKFRQSSVCARSLKLALAERIPEIAAYITKPTARPQAKPELHESAYALPDALRERIRIDNKASIRLRN